MHMMVRTVNSIFKILKSFLSSLFVNLKLVCVYCNYFKDFLFAK